MWQSGIKIMWHHRGITDFQRVEEAINDGKIKFLEVGFSVTCKLKFSIQVLKF